jgi:hypothetical protein
MTPLRASPRHPAARARGADLARSAELLLRRESGAALGVTGPERAVAVAALAWRGQQQRTRAEFAAAYGIGEGEVAEIESGCVAADDLPAVLRLLTPLESIAHRLSLGPAVVGLPGRRAHQ